MAGGFGDTPPVSCRPGVQRGARHSIHHEVDNRSLIHHDVRDQKKCHEVLVVAHRVLCEAGGEEPFDELSARIFSPTLTWHSHLMSAQLGFCAG